MLLVIKMGGSILKEGASNDLVADLKEVAKEHKVVLVHGGGVEVTEIASKLGKEQKFIMSPEGFRSRYTDKEQSKSTPWLWRVNLTSKSCWHWKVKGCLQSA
jgi:acetylglutamate/LysW-gamma-L-alpha-aminoadipate kinase